MLAGLALFALFSSSDAAIIISGLIALMGIIAGLTWPSIQLRRNSQQLAEIGGQVVEARDNAATAAQQVLRNGGSSMFDQLADRLDRLDDRLDKQAEWMGRMDRRLINVSERTTRTDERLDRIDRIEKRTSP